MKNSRIVLALILVATMLFTLAGCAKESDQLLGSWEAKVDLAGVISDTISSVDEDMGKYIKINKLEMSVTFTFKEDGTYEVKADKDFLVKSVEAARADMKEGLEKMYQDILNERNSDMTVDEMLASQGLTLDDLCDQMLGDEFVNTMIKSMDIKGKFKAKDGKLFMSAGLEYGIDEKAYEVYEISDKQLKLVESVGTDSDDEYGAFADDMYPIVFTRVETAA